jgi:glyoxylase-like metal-dependent hydrolase (beta-lactamase superfamily II)/rhodanese-related sulfurtransferase
MIPFGLRQFRNEGCQSYIIFDSNSRACAVIDPQISFMPDYRDFIASQRLKPVYALDTHIHADHLSATHLFRAEFGAKVAMAAGTKSERPDTRLEHGQKITVGTLEIQALATPGHTPDSCSFVVSRAGSPARAVFTGDTLFIGGSGRTDFPGADAAQQFSSIHDVLGKLREDTLVYPGHDYGDFLFSTIGVESRRNPHWAIRTPAEFEALKGSEKIVNPEGAVRKMVEFNMHRNPPGPADAGSGPCTACGAPVGDGDRVATISVEKLQAKMDKPEAGTAFIDVREPEEFAEGHLPGAVNIPLGELGLHLDELSKLHRCYLSCERGGRSILAAKTLSYLGVPGAVNVTGGFLAWQNAGHRVEK